MATLSPSRPRAEARASTRKAAERQHPESYVLLHDEGFERSRTQWETIFINLFAKAHDDEGYDQPV
ncbi:MAG: hypothetical protein K0S79_1438 [Nitrospira sp.]|nr:hypothetical protein [Nitrospira sp.]